MQVSGGFDSVPDVQASFGIGRIAPVQAAHLRAAQFTAFRGVRGNEDQLPAVRADQNIFSEREKRGVGRVRRGREQAFLRPRQLAGNGFDAHQVFRRPQAVDVISNRDRAGKVWRRRLIDPDLLRLDGVGVAGNPDANQASLK